MTGELVSADRRMCKLGFGASPHDSASDSALPVPGYCRAHMQRQAPRTPMTPSRVCGPACPLSDATSHFQHGLGKGSCAYRYVN